MFKYLSLTRRIASRQQNKLINLQKCSFSTEKESAVKKFMESGAPSFMQYDLMRRGAASQEGFKTVDFGESAIAAAAKIPDVDFGEGWELPDSMQLPRAPSTPHETAAAGMWLMASRFGEEMIIAVEKDLVEIGEAIETIPSKEEYAVMLKKRLTKEPLEVQLSPSANLELKGIGKIKSVPLMQAEVDQYNNFEFTDVKPRSDVRDFFENCRGLTSTAAEMLADLAHPAGSESPKEGSTAIHPIIYSAMHELATHGTLHTFPLVVEAFTDLMRAHRKQLVGVVTSAQPLKASEIAKCKAFLEDQLKEGETLILESKVDKLLVAGFKLTVKQQLWDLSASSQLFSAKKEFDSWVSSTPWSFSDGKLFGQAQA